MSGPPLPLRSLWFGDGLTSATTEDSARNADTGMTREYSCILKSWFGVCAGGYHPAICAETPSRDKRGGSGRVRRLPRNRRLVAAEPYLASRPLAGLNHQVEISKFKFSRQKGGPDRLFCQSGPPEAGRFSSN